MTNVTSEVITLKDNNSPVTVVGTWYNVKDFGAVGDGKSDDTEAIKSALKKVTEKAGGTLYFPDGQYLITQKITFGTECILSFAEKASILSTADVRINGYIKSDSHIIFEGSGENKYSLKNTSVNPVWFGAKGDGKTDDTNAFVTALSAGCNEIHIPYSKNGFCIGDIKISRALRVVGESKGDSKTKLIGISSAENLFTFLANSIYFSNMQIDMSKTDKATVFHYDTSAIGKDDYILRDIDVYGAYCVVDDAGVVTNYVTNSLVDNVNCYNCRGTAFDLKCFWGFVFFRNLVIDNSKSAKMYGVRTNFAAVKLENNAGCIFQNMKIIGDGNKDCANQVGFRYNNNVATWMDRCTFENLGGNAVVTRGSNSHLYFSNLEATGIGGNAYEFNSVQILQLHALNADGGSKTPSGIVLNGCMYTQVTDCNISNMSGDGISVANSNGISCTGCKIEKSGKFGVNVTSGNGVVFIDCKFNGNNSGVSSGNASIIE